MSTASETIFRITLVLAGLLAALTIFTTAAQAGSVSRAQAVRGAKQYLGVSAFSYKGLVRQLEFDGFSVGDSRYGAGHARANWNREAVKAARQYLSISAFSRSGMVRQLVFDGFTRAQALHGAGAVGL